MCFNMALVTERDELEREFSAHFDTDALPLGFKIHNASGFTHPRWPVVTSGDAGHFIPLSWGLVPRWCRDREQALQMQDRTLNARAETIGRLPSFRGPAKEAMRCIIPVSGFYEPYRHGKVSYPFYLHKAGKLFALAGLYEYWRGPATGRVHGSFSLITVPSKGIVDRIHHARHRMPLVLSENQYEIWLDPESSESVLAELLFDSPAPELLAHPVSRGLYSRSTPLTDHTARQFAPTGIEEVDSLAVL